jgi:hypothetical protein
LGTGRAADEYTSLAVSSSEVVNDTNVRATTGVTRIAYAVTAKSGG